MAAANVDDLELQRTRAERRLAAQYAVTRVLAEAPDLALATQRLLEAMCTTLEWELGALWTIDPKRQLMTCIDLWPADSTPFPRFAEATRGLQLQCGEGLAGRVWEAAKPIWVPDVLTDQHFTRAGIAGQDGIRSAFFSPVACGDEILGIVELYSSELRRPDESLLRMMYATADQIGQFIERKRAEEAARVQQVILEAQNEASLDGLLVVALDGAVLSCNQRFLDLWEIPSDVGETRSNAAYTDAIRHRVADPRAFDERLRELYEDPDLRVREEMVLKDGRTFDRYTTPLRAPDGTFHGRAWSFRDITEQKRAENVQRLLIQSGAELDASLDFETTLVNVAHIALPHLADWCVISLSETDGSIRRVASAHVDPSKQQLLDQFQTRYRIDPTSHHPVAEVIRTGVSQLNPEVGPERMQSIAPDDQHVEMVSQLGVASSMIVPLRARGRTIGAISFVLGQTRRRYTEADLSLAEDLARRAALSVDNARLFEAAQQAVEMRDEFLAAASHDLKGPLATIKGLAQLLTRFAKRTPPESSRLLEGLANIDGATNKMTSLINQLLDISRVEMGHPLSLDVQPTDLVALVRRVVRDQKTLINHHQVAVIADENKLVGDWDSERIERVITNLFTNAIKYSPDGGDVVLRVRLAEDSEFPVPAAIVEVRDSGIGIPAAELPRIFDHFHRAKNAKERVHGSGVGLASVRQIVTQHGGDVRVESEEGKGSTFTVVLPLDSTEDLLED